MISKVKLGLIFISSIITSLTLQKLGLLESIELQWYDLANSSSPQYRAPITIVTFDEEDIKKYNWPLNDELLSQAINTIKKQDPIAIGMDIYRNTPVPPGTNQLNQTFTNTPNLIGIEKVIGSGVDGKIPPPLLLKKKQQVAAVDIPVDADEKIRRGLLFPYAQDEPNLPSLSLALAFKYLEKQNISPQANKDGWMILGKQTFLPFKSSDGGYAVANDGSYQIIIDYRTQFNQISLTRVIENKDLPPNTFQDRLVMIGAFAPSLNDIHSTPKGRISGVEIQAQMTAQIIDLALGKRNQLTFIPEPLEILFLITITAASQVVICLYMNRFFQTLGLLVISISPILLVALVSYLAFIWSIWLPIVSVIISLILVNFLTALSWQFSSLKQAAKTHKSLQEKYARELQVIKSQIADREGITLMGQIVNSIALEIENPLAFITNLSTIYQQKIQDNAVDIDELYQGLSSIEKYADNILTTIQEILKLGQINNFKPEEFNLHHLIQECLNVVDTSEIEMEVNLDRRTETIVGDREMLATILNNLIRNAIEALSEISSPTIVIASRWESENIKIEIIDNGSTIPSQDVKKIFNIFYTTKPNNKGLGLWIASEYAKVMKGKIEVESQFNTYTKFTILLAPN
ncbi:CHASE2 domain-containing protein [Merismopedia glauca]|uniref:Histidine kinase domain-containing protein n=1 Tax=Merismopedia glauca CCAP 1448/3 TaxID=1296344 RepID=A0A2T1BZA8_9CYAN|nr:CHASE2 domain-containing protein [Merismopedia glauca]PSB01365.1 hypothetical protein C7B64_18690 [Merismopedia glauca CCAP 1448/3]